MRGGQRTELHAGGAARAAGVLRTYAELTKVRLVLLVVTTTAVGFLMASSGRPGVAQLCWTLIGTALAAAGSMALNQVLERARDARMERTMHRPLPAGTITPRHARVFGVLTASAGIAVLAVAANPLTAVLGLIVVLTYTLVYTPLKARTPLCTLAGALCGAIPPMMGWTATGGGIGFGAWLLGGVLFLWQIPHFLALAWLYRADYERGGFRMLPVVDASGRVTGQMAVLYSLALVPLGVLAALGSITGWLFAAGSVLLGSGLVALSLQLATLRTDPVARRLFHATLVYLPLLLGLMVADKLPAASPLAVALLSNVR